MSRTPFRQTWTAVPLASLVSSGLAACATLALVRIQSIRRTRGCGAWVFVSPEGVMFVLSDEASALPGMQRDNPGWLVGYFCDSEGGKGPRPALTLADLSEAIVAHMAGVAPLKPEVSHAA